MNKEIKRLVAMLLVLTAFSVVSPVKYLKNFNLNVAYASTDDDDEEEAIENSYLDDLEISEGKLDFSEKKTEYTVKIDSSDESIVVTATAKNSTDKIKIDGSSVLPLVDNKAEKTVELNKGRNLIKIKVETQDYGIRTYNLVVNRGSASNSDDSDGVYLDSITLSDGSISYSKNKMAYDVNVNSSINEIRIAAQPEYDDYEVKIDGISVDKDESYRRTIKLTSGKNTILIDLEDNEGNEQTYTLNIYRGGTNEVNASQVIDNEQDPIYLDDIVIEDGSIPLNFKPKVTSYVLNVKENWDNIVIKAKPEYDDVVRVNGTTTADPYMRRVNLEEGKNVIQIKVNNSNSYDRNDDEFEERLYTLTVYRGTSQSNSSNNGQITSTDVKTNQWININGKWKYNDSVGNYLKNTWYFDESYGKNYYFKEDGTMATGWVSYNGNWYCLDSSGAMITGWFKDTNGKWYYLNSTGQMVTSTTINGYKIDTNGVWVF
ncbi:MAG: cadherin-like beta sandwich domain-containing protein [Clostridium sp.]|uniref:N-acetylmuramoyl-L-alanine amidase family protein n=1 Tax=Clostridium sp. TaxID=1506 RepID=UPI0025BA2F14|nr:cadherin-like beta sandwich domain-containing protein [Clostridium sp.]MCE5221762.1 cadherin-like beta sandwich domain-containing protein [Clostridium sp.]